MQHILKLTILTPEKTLFDGRVDSVTLPGSDGSFTILPRHAPIISSLEAGTIRYVAGDKIESLSIMGGFIELSNDNISICVEQKIVD